MGKLANASSKDGRMLPSTNSQKDLSVTPLVTATREQASFFCREGSFFLRLRRHFSYQGLLRFFGFFKNIFLNLILIFFFYLSHVYSFPKSSS